MEEKRKPNRWRLWLVIGLGLLVGYPLSFGPAYWGVQRIKHPASRDAFHDAFLIAYHPLVMLACRNETAAEWAGWYLRSGQRKPRATFFVYDKLVEWY